MIASKTDGPRLAAAGREVGTVWEDVPFSGMRVRLCEIAR